MDGANGVGDVPAYFLDLGIIIDPCDPTVFVAVCFQDTDLDGVTDYDEGEFVDSDGDGLMDYEESSILDSDMDTLVDQDDPDNANSCIPDETFCIAQVPMLTPENQVVLALLLIATGITLFRVRRLDRSA